MCPLWSCNVIWVIFGPGFRLDPHNLLVLSLEPWYCIQEYLIHSWRIGLLAFSLKSERKKIHRRRSCDPAFLYSAAQHRVHASSRTCNMARYVSVVDAGSQLVSGELCSCVSAHIIPTSLGWVAKGQLISFTTSLGWESTLYLKKAFESPLLVNRSVINYFLQTWMQVHLPLSIVTTLACSACS